MSTRLLSRLFLAAIVVIPVLVVATPQTPVSPRATSQWISVDPVDSEHSRVTVNRGVDGDEIVCDAKSATISFTTDGMVADMKGPGTMTMKGAKATAFSTLRLTFTNGRFSGLAVRGGPSSR
jgi:hypothetical protein